MSYLVWLVAAILVLAVVFRVLQGAQKFGLASNVLLAKHTWDCQSDASRAAILQRAKEIFSRASSADWELLESPIQAPWKYSLFALAMLELDIPPAVEGEGWYAPKKPFDISLGDPSLEMVRKRLERLKGVRILLK